MKGHIIALAISASVPVLDTTVSLISASDAAASAIRAINLFLHVPSNLPFYECLMLSASLFGYFHFALSFLLFLPFIWTHSFLFPFNSSQLEAFTLPIQTALFVLRAGIILLKLSKNWPATSPPRRVQPNRCGSQRWLFLKSIFSHCTTKYSLSTKQRTGKCRYLHSYRCI